MDNVTIQFYYYAITFWIVKNFLQKKFHVQWETSWQDFNENAAGCHSLAPICLDLLSSNDPQSEYL